MTACTQNSLSSKHAKFLSSSVSWTTFHRKCLAISNVPFLDGSWLSSSPVRLIPLKMEISTLLSHHNTCTVHMIPPFSFYPVQCNSIPGRMGFFSFALRGARTFEWKCVNWIISIWNLTSNNLYNGHKVPKRQRERERRQQWHQKKKWNGITRRICACRRVSKTVFFKVV